jgi:hypothetical protein
LDLASGKEEKEEKVLDQSLWKVSLKIAVQFYIWSARTMGNPQNEIMDQRSPMSPRNRPAFVFSLTGTSPVSDLGTNVVKDIITGLLVFSHTEI